MEELKEFTQLSDLAWKEGFPEHSSGVKMTECDCPADGLKDAILEYMRSVVLIDPNGSSVEMYWKAFLQSSGLEIDVSRIRVEAQKIERIRILPAIMKLDGKGAISAFSNDFASGDVVKTSNAREARRMVREAMDEWLKDGRAADILSAVAKGETPPADNGYAVSVAVHQHECPTCLGKKTLTCNACRGKGKHDCHTCHGSGRCPTCRGTQRIPCSTCGGEGEVKESCDRCSGTGRIFYGSNGSEECWECRGRGRVSKRCPTCKGAAYYPCHDCDDGICLSCNGAKTVPCRTCDTKGSVTCAACDGTGVVYNGYAGYFRVEKEVTETLPDGLDMGEGKERILRNIERLDKDWRVASKKKNDATLIYSCLSTCVYDLYKSTVTMNDGSCYVHYAVFTDKDGWVIFPCQNYVSIYANILSDVPEILRKAGLFRGDIYETLKDAAFKMRKVNNIKTLLEDSQRDSTGRQILNGIRKLLAFSWLRPSLVALGISLLTLLLVSPLAGLASSGMTAILTEEHYLGMFVEAAIKRFCGYDIFEDVFQDRATWMPIFTCLFAYLSLVPGYIYLKRALRIRKEKIGEVTRHNHELFDENQGVFRRKYGRLFPVGLFFAGMAASWWLFFHKDFSLILSAF